MIQKQDLSVLLIVQAGRKHGIGHLMRALQIAQLYTNPIFFIISDTKNLENIKEFVSDYTYFISNPDNKLNISNILKELQIDLLICDCPQASYSMINNLKNHPIPMITMDNATLGSYSEIYLAPLPTYKPNHANFSEIYHTPINTKYFLAAQKTITIKNILISLGGSDPNNNAEKIVNALKDSSYNITVIAGPFSTYNIEEQENIKVISQVNDLFPYIQQNDLIFCGPGSTLLECLAAKKHIVAVAHTYQQFKDLSILSTIHTLMGGLFLTSKQIKNSIHKASSGNLSLPEDFDYQQWFISLGNMIINRVASCPLCGSYDKYALRRNKEQNQFLCNNCRSVYLYNLKQENIQENGDLIIADNSEQTQQSYKYAVLNLREDSHRRIQIIKKILPIPTNHNSYKLLDIGAEHGIFVQEALHNGFSAQGVELSDFARRIASDQHNINIIDNMNKIYDNGPIHNIVTIWKKLELLEHPRIYLKKISSLIPLGGMLAFRIPIADYKTALSTGIFKVTEKGGYLLTEQIGFFVAQTVKYTNKNKEEFLEFYCIKRLNNELY